MDCPKFQREDHEEEWHRIACQHVGTHLCKHVDINLHPRMRDDTNAITADASDDAHATAFLEHHRHGIEIVKCFNLRWTYERFSA